MVYTKYECKSEPHCHIATSSIDRKDPYILYIQHIHTDRFCVVSVQVVTCGNNPHDNTNTHTFVRLFVCLFVCLFPPRSVEIMEEAEQLNYLVCGRSWS